MTDLETHQKRILANPYLLTHEPIEGTFSVFVANRLRMERENTKHAAITLARLAWKQHTASEENIEQLA